MHGAQTRSSYNRKLHAIALVTVAIGATVGIAASLAAWAIHGAFSTTTFLASLFAITSAAPVLRDYREMRRHADGRCDERADRVG